MPKFSDAKTLTFSTMIKKTQLYKIIVGRNYKKLDFKWLVKLTFISFLLRNFKLNNPVSL